MTRGYRRGLILDASNEVFVSVATLWQIAIKYQLGRDDMPVSAPRAAALFRGFAELSILREHALAVETLPAVHGDPFDRTESSWRRRLPDRCAS
jgi:PIN domain nuclease of toxin-antitoxin system